MDRYCSELWEMAKQLQHKQAQLVNSFDILNANELLRIRTSYKCLSPLKGLQKGITLCYTTIIKKL